MKQFQISEYFTVKDNCDHVKIKQTFDERLGQVFKIHNLKEEIGGHIVFKALTGSRNTFFHHMQMQVVCDITLEKNVLRIMTTGEIRPASSQIFLYIMALLTALLIGFMPGPTLASWESASALDAVILLLIGGYVIHDKQIKMQGAESLMQDVISAIEAEFGA